MEETVLGYSTPPTNIYIPGLKYSITLDNILYIKIHFYNKEVGNYSFQRILELERGLDIPVDVNAD